jgi:indole-3-glycerol phosphate synthase
MCYGYAAWLTHWFRPRNNLSNLQIIIENANIPVIVDAGIGAPSEATMAMELGADGILLIVLSRNKQREGLPASFERYIHITPSTTRTLHI